MGLCKKNYLKWLQASFNNSNVTQAEFDRPEQLIVTHILLQVYMPISFYIIFQIRLHGTSNIIM